MGVQGYGCARLWVCKGMGVQGCGSARLWECMAMGVQGYGCARLWACKVMRVHGSPRHPSLQRWSTFDGRHPYEPEWSAFELRHMPHAPIEVAVGRWQNARKRVGPNTKGVSVSWASVTSRRHWGRGAGTTVHLENGLAAHPTMMFDGTGWERLKSSDKNRCRAILTDASY